MLCSHLLLLCPLIFNNLGIRCGGTQDRIACPSRGHQFTQSFTVWLSLPIGWGFFR